MRSERLLMERLDYDLMFRWFPLWYCGTIVLCTVAGALLGPRLLRW